MALFFRGHARQFCVIAALFFLSMTFGCAQKQLHPTPEPSASTGTTSAQTAIPDNSAPQKQSTPSKSAAAINAEKKVTACAECASMNQEKERGKCYKLQPGTVTKTKKGKKSVGRCQPQCIQYARCRSGFMSCKLGDTSPVGWFYCAQKNGDTSSLPIAGSVMVIGGHKDRGMATGHLGYVEEVCPNSDGTFTLRFSHSNYDRQCHLDLDAKVIFNPQKMEANFISGYWKAWAKNLKILGFITK